MSRLQDIKTLADFEQFGPADTATESQVNDLCDIHSIFESECYTGRENLKCEPVHVNRAVALVIQYNHAPEQILHCPIDHSGNTKIESTPAQSWMLFAPLSCPFAIAYNGSGAFILEPINK